MASGGKNSFGCTEKGGPSGAPPTYAPRGAQRGTASGTISVLTHTHNCCPRPRDSASVFAQVSFKLLTAPAVAECDGYGALGVVLADNETVEFRDDFPWRKVSHVLQAFYYDVFVGVDANIGGDLHGAPRNFLGFEPVLIDQSAGRGQREEPPEGDGRPGHRLRCKGNVGVNRHDSQAKRLWKGCVGRAAALVAAAAACRRARGLRSGHP